MNQGPGNQHDSERGTPPGERLDEEDVRARTDKLDPQDPQRHHMQPRIPTHPPDPAAAGDADKVVGPDKPDHDPNQPPHVNTAIGSGPTFDQVGGPGMGEAPGKSPDENPATTRARDTRAEDLQDRTRET